MNISSLQLLAAILSILVSSIGLFSMLLRFLKWLEGKFSSRFRACVVSAIAWGFTYALLFVLLALSGIRDGIGELALDRESTTIANLTDAVSVYFAGLAMFTLAGSFVARFVGLTRCCRWGIVLSTWLAIVSIGNASIGSIFELEMGYAITCCVLVYASAGFVIGMLMGYCQHNYQTGLPLAWPDIPGNGSRKIGEQRPAIAG